MDPDLPWLEYTKATLPRGFSNAVGRDEVELALRGTGARVGLLSFGPPVRAAEDGLAVVLEVSWIGDAKSRVSGAPRTDRHRLSMTWSAVPALVRGEMRTEIAERWLPAACVWAASAPGRGNVWRGKDHRWMLLRSEQGLTVTTE